MFLDVDSLTAEEKAASTIKITSQLLLTYLQTNVTADMTAIKHQDGNPEELIQGRKDEFMLRVSIV